MLRRSEEIRAGGSGEWGLRRLPVETRQAGDKIEMLVAGEERGLCWRARAAIQMSFSGIVSDDRTASVHGVPRYIRPAILSSTTSTGQAASSVSHDSYRIR
jgi:hypothetical protein